jgi:hypothetical protein
MNTKVIDESGMQYVYMDRECKDLLNKITVIIIVMIVYRYNDIDNHCMAPKRWLQNLFSDYIRCNLLV